MRRIQADASAGANVLREGFGLEGLTGGWGDSGFVGSGMGQRGCKGQIMQRLCATARQLGSLNVL